MQLLLECSELKNRTISYQLNATDKKICSKRQGKELPAAVRVSKTSVLKLPNVTSAAPEKGSASLVVVRLYIHDGLSTIW